MPLKLILSYDNHPHLSRKANFFQTIFQDSYFFINSVPNALTFLFLSFTLYLSNQ